MSEISKTEAVVLSKINYGDTSNIVSLYTKEYGKLSAIIKGGRSPKSKMGFIVDPLNHLQLILYKKESREVQLTSAADIISPFNRIKEDLEKLKYSYAVLELIKKLVPEHENNYKLFKALIRILNLFDTSNEQPKILFSKFFIFFLTEMGYEMNLNECSACGKSLRGKTNLSYNYSLGILCSECSVNYFEVYQLNQELFHYMICLKNNYQGSFKNTEIIDKGLVFMEKFLKFHVPDFKSFQSFQLFT